MNKKNINLQERFEKFEDDYLEFEKINNKRSLRPDLHAFILLDELFPGKKEIISSSGYEEIYLDIDIEEFRLRITDLQIQELVRCGIRYHKEFDCLALYV